MTGRMVKRLLAVLLCLAVLGGSFAFADAEIPAAEAAEDPGILDPAALQQIVDDYCRSKGLDPENLSVGFCYTATGDTWYWNPDAWYYSASMYKVPVMMILAERYKAGEITDETKISGLTLAEANELILVYSHNDYAHAMMHYIGTDAECRTLYQQYAQLPAEYYVQDFYDYSYFTARFMTQVMQTLYTEQERFPNVVEHLLLAQPGQYFKAGITDVPVAQKYGNFMDSMGRQFTHDTGIVYTDNPFILTVMTKNMGASDTVIAQFCGAFEDYARSLDAKLPAYQQQKRQEAEEEARRLAEEEARRLAEEEAAAAAAAAEEAAPAQQTGESPDAGQSPAETQPAPEAAAAVEPVRPHGARRSVMIGFGVIIVLLLAGFLVEAAADRRERDYARAARSRGGRR
ncbi:MAG: serine hydrolase [Oscillospiraceae bacterium]|nr:serine hydrolase [Oscillospiraceae bacterium]